MLFLLITVLLKTNAIAESRALSLLVASCYWSADLPAYSI